MATNMIVAIAVLIGAYGLTWFLFFRSLRVIKLIDKENLSHAGQIRDRLEGEEEV